MRTLYTLFMTFIAVIFQLAIADGQSEILTREVRVVDQNGNPVRGAVADSWLINERYFWPSKKVPRIPVKSDANGVAAIRYPKDISYSNTLPVESIKMTVSHANFCNVDIVVPVGTGNDKPYEVKLTPGIALALDAVGEDGKPLTKPFSILTTRMASVTRWNRPTPSQANCRSMKSGNQQLMLVQPREDGRHCFSEVMSYRFDAEKEPEVTLEEIELRPGISIRGKLADKVPRPAKKGIVIAVHVPLPAGDSWDEKLPSLIFYSSADLKTNGTFEFASMPRTGTIQLIAVCDGWVGLQDEKKSFIVGQTFEVADEALEVELEMDKTFEANIRVVDKKGQPVEGVEVTYSPNQLFKMGGSTILGEKFDSMPGLLGQLKDEIVPIEGIEFSQFQGVSNKDGRLTIQNLPRNRFGSRFVVWSASTKAIKTDENVEGKLPSEDENQVTFEIVVELLPEVIAR